MRRKAVGVAVMGTSTGPGRPAKSSSPASRGPVSSTVTGGIVEVSVPRTRDVGAHVVDGGSTLEQRGGVREAGVGVSIVPPSYRVPTSTKFASRVTLLAPFATQTATGECGRPQDSRTTFCEESITMS